MRPSEKLFVTGFKLARPQFETIQSSGLDWLAAAHTQAETTLAARSGQIDFNPEYFEKRLRKALERFGCGSDRISRRGHEIPDFLHRNWSQMQLFRLEESPSGVDLGLRTDFFEVTAERIFEHLYSATSTETPGTQIPPDEIIHVTCTGYASPSAAQRLVVKRGWNKKTWVTHCYHMGCSAAFPALRLARGTLAVSRNVTRVDLIHNELCTLHLNPSDHSPEQLVVQSLFADGSILYSLEREDSAEAAGALELLALHEEIADDFLDAMSWKTSGWGMKMSLSKDIPNRLGLSIRDFFERLLRKSGLDFRNEQHNALFAIHPGGPKIVDQLQRTLELSDEQVAGSRSILFQYGNMSSATVPHIWSEMASNEAVKPGTLIISVAFGPGLTMCGAVLRKAG